MSTISDLPRFSDVKTYQQVISTTRKQLYFGASKYNTSGIFSEVMINQPINRISLTQKFESAGENCLDELRKKAFAIRGVIIEDVQVQTGQNFLYPPFPISLQYPVIDRRWASCSGTVIISQD